MGSLSFDMISTYAFSGPSGRYEVTVPEGVIDLEDHPLSVFANSVESRWFVETDETNEQGSRTLSGVAGDGSGLWFVLTLGTPCFLSYWGDSGLIRTDKQVI
jgi:hypothetical protein